MTAATSPSHLIARPVKGPPLMLHAAKYRTSPNAPRVDDGIVDDVAVDRRIAGEPIALTGRELAAAITRCVTRGMTDKDIGRALDITFDAVLKVRVRHGLAAVTRPGRPGTRSVTSADRRPRTVDGMRRFPLNQPLPLIYGTTNGTMDHGVTEAPRGIVRWIA